VFSKVYIHRFIIVTFTFEYWMTFNWHIHVLVFLYAAIFRFNIVFCNTLLIVSYNIVHLLCVLDYVKSVYVFVSYAHWLYNTYMYIALIVTIYYISILFMTSHICLQFKTLPIVFMLKCCICLQFKTCRWFLCYNTFKVIIHYFYQQNRHTLLQVSILYLVSKPTRPLSYFCIFLSLVKNALIFCATMYVYLVLEYSVFSVLVVSLISYNLILRPRKEIHVFF